MKYYDCRNLKILPGVQKPLLNVVLEDNTEYTALEPRMFFPVCHRDRIISLVETDPDSGKENGALILNNLGDLDETSRIALKQALDYYYMIPVIKNISSFRYQRGMLHWHVDTDRGENNLDITAPMRNIRMEADGTIFVRDIHDNRYEIKNLPALSKKTQRSVMKFL